MSRELQAMNQQNKLSLWAGGISECRNSGMAVKVWCRENGVCEQTYYKWQKRLFEMAHARRKFDEAVKSLPKGKAKGSSASQGLTYCNLLFANPQKGAIGSAVMFSLIQTAIENNLDPYKHLAWLMQQAKDADLTDDQVVQSLLPWNMPTEY